MPRRGVFFANGEYYHVFNRGVAKMPIFLRKRDYIRFIQGMEYYNQTPLLRSFSQLKLNAPHLKTSQLVTIISFCLMPNHFHLLLQQDMEDGIIDFLKRHINSYVKYFNLKNERVGPLFQGNFKAVHVEDTEQLLQVDRYIHLNPVSSYLVKYPQEYLWSSYGNTQYKICDRKIIDEQFKTRNDYEKFVLDHADYLKHQEDISHLTLE